MADVRINRRQILAGAGVGALGAVAAAGMPAGVLAAESGSSGIVGSWKGIHTSNATGSRPEHFLLAFVPGGIFFDFESSPGQTTGVGTWNAEAGNSVSLKFEAFLLNGNGGTVGILTVWSTVFLMSGGNMFEGTYKLNGTDFGGHVLFTDTGTVSATRIMTDAG